MSPSISSRVRQLDTFFARASALPQDSELRADMARHGIVLTCGFIERCVEEIILDRVKKLANVKVQKFIKGHFKRGTNYNCSTIALLLDRFDADWATNFQLLIKDRDDLVQAVLSAYEVRNSIAHGGNSTKGLANVIGWFKAAQEVVEAISLATNSSK